MCIYIYMYIYMCIYMYICICSRRAGVQNCALNSVFHIHRQKVKMVSSLKLPMYKLILLTHFANLIVLFPPLSTNCSSYTQFTERFLVE
jgi:hypothetical protein